MDKYLLNYCDKLKNDSDFNKVMSLMYALCFQEFNKAWCQTLPSNIMNFTQFLSDIFTTKFERSLTQELNEHFNPKKSARDQKMSMDELEAELDRPKTKEEAAALIDYILSHKKTGMESANNTSDTGIELV